MSEMKIYELAIDYALKEFSTFEKAEAKSIVGVGNDHKDFDKSDPRYHVELLLTRPRDYINEKVAEFSADNQDNARLFLEHPEKLLVVATSSKIIRTEWLSITFN